MCDGNGVIIIIIITVIVVIFIIFIIVTTTTIDTPCMYAVVPAMPPHTIHTLLLPPPQRG